MVQSQHDLPRHDNNAPDSTPVVAAPGALSITDLEQLESAVIRRVEMIQRIKASIDVMVTPDCFNGFGDKIRRNNNYAKAVHAALGGTFEYMRDEHNRPLVEKHEYEDTEGKYYVFEAWGAYTIAGDGWQQRNECTAIFSSRDKFFGKVDDSFKASHDVDERSVRQACLTELFKKCVLGILGYGDASREELERAGRVPETYKGHKHKAGKQGGSKDTPDQADKRGEIEIMCRDLLSAGYSRQGLPKPTSVDMVCKTITDAMDGNWQGWMRIKRISDKSLDRTFNDIQAVHSKFCGADSTEEEREDDLPT